MGWRKVPESSEDNAPAPVPKATRLSASATMIQKWGGLASFLMGAAFIIPQWIYLTGNLRAPGGRLVYALADFLYGPLWASSPIAEETQAPEVHRSQPDQA